MNNSSSAYITIKNLLVGWQARAVCQISSLDLSKGSITVLCGPNGAGKSTLLKTIAKQVTALEGEIRIDAANLAEMSSLEVARRLAFVPQFLETRRSLSVDEWVTMGRNPHQQWWSWASSAADRKKVDEALARTSCTEFREKMIDELSGGERQRALIATALAQEPVFLLLDEPTAHLDFRHQLELLELLKQLRDEGLGILVVLHDLNLVSRIADQVILLKKEPDQPGKIAASGSVKDVLSADCLREVYGVEMEIISIGNGEAQTYFAKSVSKK